VSGQNEAASEVRSALKRPVDPHRRRVKLATAATARKQRDACNEGFHDAPSSVEGERRPFLFEVAVDEGVRQLGRAEGAELLVEQVELAI
jgi:hypothetical protein